jgi:glycerol-3-phosphate acyltransferase PlsX
VKVTVEKALLPTEAVRVALDAMGGDYAPAVVVEGGLEAARLYDVEVILVGPEEAVRAELGRYDVAGLPVAVQHASEVIEMHEHPAAAVRAKKDSSIVVGMNLVKEGRAEACVSMGNTGGMLAAALFRLGRLPGVRRPALATVFPTMGGFCLLLDIGASADCKPEYLLQFAVMGAAYAQRVLGIENPRVGLVSNGEEETKGSTLVQEAHALLQAAPGLNFVGNVEGKEVMYGQVDVAVTDGFTGNVTLKFAEGVGSMMKEIIRQELYRTPLSKLGGLLARGAFARVEARLDYAEYGGAPLLGVNGVVIIGHGRSNARAVRNAVRVAVQAVRQGILGAIRDGLDAGGCSRAW